MRNKLEREVSLQKPKLEVLTNKREELEKRLSACSTKETELHSNCQELMAGIDNEEFKQILQDAMRMKQLEVLIRYSSLFSSESMLTGFSSITDGSSRS